MGYFAKKSIHWSKISCKCSFTHKKMSKGVLPHGLWTTKFCQVGHSAGILGILLLVKPSSSNFLFPALETYFKPIFSLISSDVQFNSHLKVPICTSCKSRLLKVRLGRVVVSH